MTNGGNSLGEPDAPPGRTIASVLHPLATFPEGRTEARPIHPANPKHVMKNSYFACLLVGLVCAAPVWGQTNEPPGAFSLLTPADGASVVVGGAEGEAPLDPETPFVVTWEASVDPDDDDVTYRWIITVVELCSETFGVALEAGAETQFEATHGEVATLLTEQLFLGLFDSVQLYHCVEASDGQATTNSAVWSATVTRGTITGVEAEDDLPGGFALLPNFPNPFRSNSTIAYRLAQAGPVQIDVYDLQGRQVASLVDTVQPAGTHTVAFDASGLPSGVYVYRMQAEGFSDTRELIVLR